MLRWGPEDRAKALAYRIEKGLRCQMCGTADWEWDPKEGGNKFAYEPVSKTCRGCELREIAQKDEDRMPGVTVVLRPTHTREWAISMLRRIRREQGRGPRSKP